MNLAIFNEFVSKTFSESRDERLSHIEPAPRQEIAGFSHCFTESEMRDSDVSDLVNALAYAIYEADGWHDESREEMGLWIRRKC